MTSQISYILLLVGLSSPIVLGKHDYFQHYYSKYYKGGSTTEAISSTKGVSTTEAISSISGVSIPEESSSSQGTSTINVISSSTLSGILSTKEVLSSSIGDSSSEEVSSSEDNNRPSLHTNTTVLQGDPYRYNERHSSAGVILGSIFLFLFIAGIVACCCISCRPGRQRRGYVLIGNRAEQASQIDPRAVIAQTTQQPVVVQQLPPQYSEDPKQQFPHLYQYQPTQPQPPHAPAPPGYQNSPNTQQFYHPPGAPPPYETIARNKY